MEERDALLRDLAERARHFATLTSLGLARRPPTVPQALAPDVAELAGDPGAGLRAIREDLGDCQRCRLAGGRKSIVFGQGSPQARLMFVGEAPGADEDEQGLAFVGRAGQLLTRIIQAIGLEREDVWIGNILKCRPPGNRNPETDEILTCQPFLERQIDAIRPKVIVGLGKFAGQWLLKTAEPITRLRGRFGDYKGIAVMPTYHPAFLLRNPGPEYRRMAWDDLKLARREYDARAGDGAR